MQHVGQQGLVARSHQCHVREAAQIGDVEGAVMGGFVVAHQAGAVHGEHHVEALEGARCARSGRSPAAGRWSRSRPPAWPPGAPARPRKSPRAARRCPRRSTGPASPSGGTSRPVPEFIAAVMPTTRSSRRHSPHQRVSEHSRVLGWRRLLRLGLETAVPRRRLAVHDRARLGRVPRLHALESAVLGGSEALSLHGLAVHDHRAIGGERLADGLREAPSRRGRRSRRRRPGQAPRATAPAVE